MKSLIVLSVLMLSMLGCTSATVCSDLEAPVAQYVAQNVVMAACTCTSEAQIQAWLITKIPANIQGDICPATKGKAKGPIGSLVCAPLINLALSAGCSQIPSCSAGNPNNAQVQALITACSGAI